MKRSSDFLPFGDLSPAEILGFLLIGLGTLLLLTYACGCGGSPFDAGLGAVAVDDAGAAPLPTPDAPLAIGRADAGAPEENSQEAPTQDEGAAPDGSQRDSGEPESGFAPDVAEAEAPGDRAVKSFPEAATPEPEVEAGSPSPDPACLACSITCSSSELVYQCTSVTSVTCGHSSYTTGDPACSTVGACTVGGPCGLSGNPACWGGTVVTVRGPSCP